jgi:hypothetical protein
MDKELTEACIRLHAAIKASEARAPIIQKKGATLYIVNRAELENLRRVDYLASTRF